LTRTNGNRTFRVSSDTLSFVSQFMKLSQSLLRAGLCALLPVSVYSQTAPVDPGPIREEMPIVQLDKLIYQSGDSAFPFLLLRTPDQVSDVTLVAILASESTGDVELVEFEATNTPQLYIPKGFIGMPVEEAAGSITPGDGVFEVAPGEVFTALVSYDTDPKGENPGQTFFSGDWAILEDLNAGLGQVDVMPGMALTQDELNPKPGGKPMGTLFIDGEVGPVQVASDELIYLPNSQSELDSFLSQTNGEVVGFQGSIEPFKGGQQQLPDAGTAWLRIKVTPDPTTIDQLPALRTLLGDTETLVASNEDTLALFAMAMQYWMEGYRVGLNPRMQLQGDIFWGEGTDDGRRINAFGRLGSGFDLADDPTRNEAFGVRNSWAYIEMVDRNTNNIPVAVIDSGFAPNPDFKTSNSLYRETNLSNGTAGIGSARTPQEVGNSFFGDKTWHGNGSVTTISAVGDNRFGNAGVGAQTAVPMLYHMGLGNFAFGFGTAIEQAVDDGASVINISAGYPCRILSVLGNDNICSTAGRAEFTTKLSLAVSGAASAACAAAPILDAFLPGLGAVTCGTSIAAAQTAALSIFGTIFLGEVMGPVEAGVAYATENGVPIVASAGNRLSDAAIGALAPFVNNDNTNIDDWQIIPAVIPDVIAVGACDPSFGNTWNGSGYNWHANLHFWGDGVDIWAPILTHFWAPEPGEADPATIPASDHIRRTFGGTSNAAPFITGVIANLMAIDPSLDRRFAPVAELPNLPGRVRDLLVNTAYQLGDPQCPDDAGDVDTFIYNAETDTFDPFDEPPELILDMQRRRNMVNPWAAVLQAAANAGLPDFGALGYDTNFRNDQFADTAAPDGVKLPLLGGTLSPVMIDEITPFDQEFWFFKTDPVAGLYRLSVYAELPLYENPAHFLINGVPGTVTGTTADFTSVRWDSVRIWNSTYFPLTISSPGRADTPYKMQVTSTFAGKPIADSLDIISRNDTIDTATVRAFWFEVPARALLEAKAFELSVPGLNFDSPDDEDFFQVEFPDPPLDVPFSCGALDPWITVQIEPATTAARIEIYSRSGGSDTLLAQGTANTSIRLDCIDYLGKLPLYVRVYSPGGLFATYRLKVRWSEPDSDTADRFERIAEANAGGREIPFAAGYFPPSVPWIFGSPGLLPPSVVNPNPAISQQLGQQGQFLASRLFLFETPANFGGNASIMAEIPVGQSLRMEVVGLYEQTLGSAATPDLSNFQNGGFVNQPLNNGAGAATQKLIINFSDLPDDTYVLRLSGHSPGDQISLYLSESLITDDTLSIEDLNGQGNGEPTLLGLPPGYLTSRYSASPWLPELTPGTVQIAEAREVRFEAWKGFSYLLEQKDENGIWRAQGTPIATEDNTPIVRYLPFDDGQGADVRIRVLGSSIILTPPTNIPALRLQYQSLPGIPFRFEATNDLLSNSWLPIDSSTLLMGDGSLQERFFSESDLPFFGRVSP
jgi:hypothetical protein